MKQILFVVPQLTHGGSNKSLATLLALFAKESDLSFSVVALNAYSNHDPYYDIFKSILLPLSNLYSISVSYTPLRKLLNALNNFLHLDFWTLLYKYEAHRLQKRYHFNKVVGFEESYATRFASYFNCTKIAWLHCDYDSYWEESNHRDESVIYSKFDSIVCVSEFAKRVFLKYYPDVADRVSHIYNLLDIEDIKRKSTEPIEDDHFSSDDFNIISIGRFVGLKQFHLIPQFVKQTLEESPNLKFHWYIIGDGDTNLIAFTQRQIENLGLHDYITLLGSKKNPYPFILKSDLLVCMSRTESWSYTINEANVLHTPVVTLRCGSSEEVIVKDAGCIINQESLPSLLATLIENKGGFYSQMKENLSLFNYNNEAIIIKLKELLT